MAGHEGLTGNFFDEYTVGVEYGSGFIPNGFTWVKDEFNAANTAEGGFSMDGLGNYTYTPAPSEIPAFGEPPNVRCCALIFKDTASGCDCQDTAIWCWSIAYIDEDNCDGAYHPDIVIPLVACVEGNIGNARTIGLAAPIPIAIYTGAAVYSLVSPGCAGETANGVAEVDSDGAISYLATSNEESTTVQFCAKVSETIGGDLCEQEFLVQVQTTAFCSDFWVADILFPAV